MYVGHEFMLTSPSEGQVDDWLDVIKHTDFLFAVCACTDACVELYHSQSHTIRPAYRVCLGESNNANTTIRISDDADHEIAFAFAATPGVLHCAVYRHFRVGQAKSRL